MKAVSIKTIGFLKWFIGVLILLQGVAVSIAEVITDGSLGPAKELTGPDFEITADLGLIKEDAKGSNLFHSFSEFNLTSSESATFSGPASIANILSRVTGGNPSNIDGLMRSTIEGANLYFLNPHGVFFGENAQIDVSGSFVVSTADYLKLKDGGVFHGLDSSMDMLTSSPPSAFGFLGADAAPIEFVGNEILVADGESFAAVGGDITVDGAEIKVPGGHVHLTSVASADPSVSAGEVQLDVTDPEAVPDVSGFTELGDILIKGTGGFDEDGDFNSDTFVDVSGTSSGRVVLRGETLEMSGSGIFANSSGNTNATGLYIDISVVEEMSLVDAAIFSNRTNAEDTVGISITLTRDFGSLSLDFSGISSDVLGGSAGNGGDIWISDVNNLSLVNGSYFSTSLEDSFGHGGNISISDVDNLSLDFSFIASDVLSSVVGGSSFGDAGDISIDDVVSLSLVDGSYFSTSVYERGFGSGGNIKLNATDIVSLKNGATINSEGRGFGDAGWSCPEKVDSSAS